MCRSMACLRRPVSIQTIILLFLLLYTVHCSLEDKWQLTTINVCRAEWCIKCLVLYVLPKKNKQRKYHELLLNPYLFVFLNLFQTTWQPVISCDGGSSRAQSSSWSRAWAWSLCDEFELSWQSTAHLHPYLILVLQFIYYSIWWVSYFMPLLTKKKKKKRVFNSYPWKSVDRWTRCRCKWELKTERRRIKSLRQCWIKPVAGFCMIKI